MTARLILKDVRLDIPIFDVAAQSMRKRVLKWNNRISDGGGGTVIVTALNDINLSLSSGDRLGLIGNNGAGKSTLLRVMAKIYHPTSGSIEVKGKTIPLLDISMGMDDNSTGRQNIRLRGLLLGMTEKELTEKTEEIAAFTELSNYIDLPLRTYSSGMKMRLAFAIATAINAKILLLDEVLGVGDAGFQEKASKRLQSMHDRADIVVLAIHSPDVIRKNCNKVLWLEKGRQKLFGNVEEVLDAYQTHNSKT